MSFKDHFSKVASAYAQFRPRYPRPLFDFLAGVVARRERAWDVGCGTGQASIELARVFDEVVASDPSAEQIANATHADHLRYVVAPAEASGLPEESVDLVTVAQALHWFDLPRFYAEVRRVARKDAVLAVWAYGACEVSAEIDPIFFELYNDIVGPYWPKERVHVENGYRDLAFPFRRIQVPALAMEARLTCEQYTGYLRTWSATRRYIEANGHDPVALVEERMKNAYGEAPRLVRWPLVIRVGRVFA